jgi:hypothetical protein
LAISLLMARLPPSGASLRVVCFGVDRNYAHQRLEWHPGLQNGLRCGYGLDGDLANANEPADTKDDLLQRLVALNQRRALEEANGQVRWLRPAF